MDAQLRTTAETRLTEAAAAAGLADPRPAYRERLRQLREAHPAAFEQAITHYEQGVLPRIAGDDPLVAWAEYGRFLCELTSDGALTRIDATGRAAPWTPEGDAGDLVLFIPSDTSGDALIVAQPRNPSAAQSASLDLLVNRKLTLG